MIIKIIVFLIAEVFIINGLSDLVLTIRLFKLVDFAKGKKLSDALDDALNKRNKDLAEIRKVEFSNIPLLNFIVFYKTLNFCFMKNDEMLVWFLNQTNRKQLIGCHGKGKSMIATKNKLIKRKSFNEEKNKKE